MADEEAVPPEAPPVKPKTPDQITGEVIDAFVLRMQSFEFLAESQIKHAKENQIASMEELIKDFKVHLSNLRDENPRVRATASNRVMELTDSIAARHAVSHVEVLAQSIFISIFS